MGTTTSGTDGTTSLSPGALSILQGLDQHDQAMALSKSPNYNATTGAPAMWRLAVGNETTPEGRLNVLRQLQQNAGITPDAQPWQGDNFIYTDPSTKRPTLYNPGSWSSPSAFGKAALSTVPDLSSAAGGIGGAVLGSAGGPLGAVAGSGAGAAATREATGEGIRGIMGVKDPRSWGEMGADVGADFAINAALQGLPSLLGRVTSPVWRYLGTRGGEVSQEALDAAAAHGVTAPLNEAQATIAAANRQGIPMTPGSLSRRPGMQATEGWLSSLGPFTGVTGDYGRAITKFGAKLDDTADAIAGQPVLSTPQAPGNAVQDASSNLIKTFQTTNNALQANLSSLIPDSTRVPITSVSSLMRGLQTADPAYSALNQRTLSYIQNNIASKVDANGTVPFGALKDLRNAVGDLAYGRTALPGEAVPQVDQRMQSLYGALKNDILAGANGVSPQAGQAARAADNYVTMMRNPNAINPATGSPYGGIGIDAAGNLAGEAPDAFARRVARGDVVSGRDIQALKQSIDNANMYNPGGGQRDWDNVAGTLFRRMGTATPGATGPADAANASFNNFATNWRAMDPETRKVLFGNLSPNLQGALNDFAVLSKGAAENATQTNWSRSGAVGNVQAAFNLLLKPLIGGVAGAGGATATGHDPFAGFGAGASLAAAPGLTYRLLRDPAFSSWLAGSMRELSASPVRLPSALSRLSALVTRGAFSDPQVHDFVKNQFLPSFVGTSTTGTSQ